MGTGVDGRRSIGKLSTGSGLAVIGVLVAAGTALAAAHFAPGHEYKATSTSCRPGAIRGTSCTFVFKASVSGQALTFIGKPVVDAWSCRNGGGEALLGGKARYATPIPVISIGKNGRLSGSVKYVVRPTSAPAENFTDMVSGVISSSGRSARITFHNLLKGGGNPSACTVGPITLTENG